MSLLKSAATISGLTLLSRVTGVIRDMLIARYFGATAETDAFYVAFRLPNMLRRLFAEGAFQQAFVPMLSEVHETKSADEEKRFIDHVFSVLATALLIVSVLGVLAAPLLVWAIASGLRENPEAFDLATQLTRWMFPYIAFMSLVALAAAILNTRKKFAVPAATPVLLNLSFIVCAVLLAPRLEEPIWALAAAVLIGGVLQLGTQVAALARLGIIVRPRNLRESFGDGAVRRVLILMVPALFGVGVAQLSLLINTNIASWLGHGAVTWLNYADRLMEFPTALLGVALGTVLLPGLSAAHARGDFERYNALLDHGLRLVVLVGIPASVGLWLTADALVSFLFQGRSFTPDDVAKTAVAVVGYSVGLMGLIGLKIIAPAFYARKDIRTPVRAAFVSLIAVQLINCVSVPLLAHAGLALSVGLGSCVNACILLVILFRRGIYTPRAGWLKAIARVAAGSAVMGAGLWWAQRGVDWTALTWTVRAAGVLGMVAAAAVVYFGVLCALGWRPSELRRAP
ncbi:murein biosynthesis integral membrane protein MurJ [Sutterella sp.]|uniref:murein biosynthesis integral membrane protein MurJ n=1 Tax=Sutterella sp. TaxID=1981025 RepID=UPI0026DFBF27|nr:murein biosynthesis integral membrane protein MurJ [Sutterella sp.]MDO5531388.1 murein biosynthesis integral membrane protein MurJ [Sutterella sp.]